MKRLQCMVPGIMRLLYKKRDSFIEFFLPIALFKKTAFQLKARISKRFEFFFKNFRIFENKLYKIRGAGRHQVAQMYFRSRIWVDHSVENLGKIYILEFWIFSFLTLKWAQNDAGPR